jgi:hypothetical protein
VVLHTASEAELLALEKALIEAGIGHKAIREPDPPYFGQLMAIGLEPQPRSKALKGLTQDLRLAR